MQVVVATAGHVDHGKSTLVRALTGMEPDRWAEERRRGMTIDLGFGWTALSQHRTVAFVDVPGHERFIGNMLAGLGPAPAVMMVVAADQGWQAQSDEHLAAIDALGLRHGLLVITRSDLADPAEAAVQARQHLSLTSLRDIPLMSVSGRTGDGIPDLRAALRRLAEVMSVPDAAARLRLWVDRAFTIRGSGTVVTGTLAEGSIVVGDELALGDRRVRVRALQALGQPVQHIAGVARVAVNLRDVHHDGIRRGDVLVRAGEWACSQVVDVHATRPPDRIPPTLHLHIGTASHPVRVRPLAGSALRLSVPVGLPLRAGDRAILRDPGGTVLIGITVLDADPPPLHRRGAAARRAAELSEPAVAADPAEQVIRRGALAAADAERAGINPAGDPRVLRVAGWWVAATQWQQWESALAQAVDGRAEDHPLDPWLPSEDARRLVGLPAAELLAPLVEAAGLITDAGRVHRPGVLPSLGPAEDAVRVVESRLRDSSFAAPDLEELAALRLGVGELRAAVSLGRVIALPGPVVLLPDAPARAMRFLSALPSPFTLSQARQALDTTRRVAVPLLEHLDQRGWTRRVDGDRREIRR